MPRVMWDTMPRCMWADAEDGEDPCDVTWVSSSTPQTPPLTPLASSDTEVLGDSDESINTLPSCSSVQKCSETTTSTKSDLLSGDESKNISPSCSSVQIGSETTTTAGPLPTTTSSDLAAIDASQPAVPSVCGTWNCSTQFNQICIGVSKPIKKPIKKSESDKYTHILQLANNEVPHVNIRKKTLCESETLSYCVKRVDGTSSDVLDGWVQRLCDTKPYKSMCGCVIIEKQARCVIFIGTDDSKLKQVESIFMKNIVDELKQTRQPETNFDTLMECVVSDLKKRMESIEQQLDADRVESLKTEVGVLAWQLESMKKKLDDNHVGSPEQKVEVPALRLESDLEPRLVSIESLAQHVWDPAHRVHRVSDNRVGSLEEEVESLKQQVEQLKQFESLKQQIEELKQLTQCLGTPLVRIALLHRMAPWLLLLLLLLLLARMTLKE